LEQSTIKCYWLSYLNYVLFNALKLFSKYVYILIRLFQYLKFIILSGLNKNHIYKILNCSLQNINFCITDPKWFSKIPLVQVLVASLPVDLTTWNDAWKNLPILRNMSLLELIPVVLALYLWSSFHKRKKKILQK
jgi:hypothetical protein